MSSLRLVLLSALVMSVTACGSSSPDPVAPSPSPSPSPVASGSPSTVSIPSGAETLGSKAFVPGELDVVVGTAVTWTNTDAVAHTSTSDAPGWNSGTIAPGRQFSTVFQTAGTFSYHCSIHPGMVGTVVVR